MRISDEDVVIIEKFIQIRNKGYYASGQEVTDVYNRVLGKRVAPTNCGSCIRQRVNELEGALNQFKKMVELDNAKEQENKEAEAQTPKESMAERMARVRAAKKKGVKQ